MLEKIIHNTNKPRCIEKYVSSKGTLSKNVMEFYHFVSQSISEQGKFKYTSADQIEKKVQELAAKAGVKTFGTKIVGFTPEEAYLRAETALTHGVADAWRTAANKRM